MGASTTPPSTEPPARIAVAYSGGRDSTALLHATARMAADLAVSAHEVGAIEVWALHVHHGLSPHADAWLAHAQAQCAAWASQGLPVRLRWCHLHLKDRLQPGEGIEAQARQARYEALARMAREAQCEAVWLAHHRRDQAETFLLQALRGAGLAGLAAMPKQIRRGDIVWERPWLDQPREAIEAYVQAHGLAHVEDESNANPAHARNRLRLQAWGALTAMGEGGQAEAGLAHAAEQLGDVLACHQAWVEAQLQAWQTWQSPVTKPGAAIHAAGGADQALLHLPLMGWAACAAAPQRELLRAWFRQVTGGILPRRWVHRLQSDLLRAAQSGRSGLQWPIRLRPPVGGLHGSGQPVLGCLALYRGVLVWRAGAGPELGAHPSPPPDWVHGFAGAEGAADGHGPGVYSVHADGCPEGLVQVVPAQASEPSVPEALLSQAQWRPRQGGERFQLRPGSTPRALKKQFQALGVPVWERHSPLLWAGDTLVFVPGLGLDARACCLPGQPRVTLEWRAPHASL